MINEVPASMLRVVLAFIGTAIVALFPFTVLVIAAGGVPADAVEVIQRYAASAAWIGLMVLAVAVAARVVKSILRRKPSAISA